jgi:hypothetical protein
VKGIDEPAMIPTIPTVMNANHAASARASRTAGGAEEDA